MRGKLIVIEGPDGSGKTSVAKRLVLTFPDLVYLREPGHTKIGESIRELIFTYSGREVPLVRTLLFSAARVALVANEILPLLEQGKNVLLDRFTMSTYVYQALADTHVTGNEQHQPRYGQVGLDTLDNLFNLILPPEIKPDLTLVLLAPIEVLESRDARGTDYCVDAQHRQRVLDAYKSIVANEHEGLQERMTHKLSWVDSSGDLEHVVGAAIEQVSAILTPKTVV